MGYHKRGTLPTLDLSGARTRRGGSDRPHPRGTCGGAGRSAWPRPSGHRAAAGAPYAGDVLPTTSRRALRRRARARLLAGVLAAGVAIPSAAAALPGDSPPPRAPVAPAAAPTPPDATAVVVIGTAGLRWADLDPGTTPALWSVTESGAVGSLVTRSVPVVSCPADGWLALGAGSRAAAPRTGKGCEEIREPADDGTVPGWDSYLAERDLAGYGARPGLLGELLAEHGRTATAFGPGAAIALANPAGVVEHHVPAPPAAAGLRDAVATALPGSDLLVVDVGAVTAPQAADDVAGRASQVAVVEERVAAVLTALDGSPAPVMLVSLADASRAPHLQVLALRGFPGAGPDPAGLVLRSAATRQDGYVLATDLLPTLLEALGLTRVAPSGALVGSRATGVPAGATGAERAGRMVDLDRHAGAIREVAPAFFALLVVANVALLAAAWLAGTGAGRPGAPTLRRFRVAGVVVGALPIGTLLANLVPWWRGGAPGAMLLVASLAAAGLLAALALLGPWRRAPLGPLTVVAAATALTLVLDVVTGSRLQLGSVLGAHPLLAGRFYGLNNSGFALLMVSSLLVAAVAGTWLVARGRRAWGVALVAVLGVVATVVDGMPGLGSDFGGPPALVPAFAVLTLLVAGVHVGWRRLVAVLAVGALVVTGFAVLDWLRPEASRTHLGRFVQTVLDGGLGDVVGRKLSQNLEILVTTGLVLLGIAAVGLVVWLVGRRRGARARERSLDATPVPALDLRTVVGAAAAELPALRHAAPTAGLGLVIGMVVNDSGAAIPAAGLALAVPLLVATLATWLLGTADGAPRPVNRAESDARA